MSAIQQVLLSAVTSPQGPTLDLIFVGVIADNTFVGPSIDLNFITETYSLPAQYAILE